MRIAWVLTLVVLFGRPCLWAANKDPGQAALRTRAVDWIKTKTHYDADDPAFAKILAQINKDIEAEKYFMLAFGGELMKSGKPHLAFGFAGEFFVFELTPKRARKLHLGDGDADYATAGGKRLDQRTSAPLARLEDLKIKNATRVGGNKRLTGEVVCQRLQDVPGKYLLRLSYRVGGTWTHQFYPLKKLSGDKRKVRFSYNALAKKKGKKPFSEPVAVFFDVCTLTQKGGVTDIKIHSNTVGTLVDVVSKRAKKKN